jgi:hypothetical protein
MKRFLYEGNMKFLAGMPETRTWRPGAFGLIHVFSYGFCGDVFRDRMPSALAPRGPFHRHRRERRRGPGFRLGPVRLVVPLMMAAGRSARPSPFPRTGRCRVRRAAGTS